MLLSASEGRHWRYEVCDHSDGYLVQMRDLETGDLDEEFSTIFRTMPVAFAYAEMSAAFERFAAAEMEAIEDDQDRTRPRGQGAQLRRPERPPPGYRRQRRPGAQVRAPAPDPFGPGPRAPLSRFAHAESALALAGRIFVP